jgi:transcriptional activator of eps genes
MRRWLQHQRIARIMAAARARVLDIRLNDNDWMQYYREQLYTPEGYEFKLNLFPLPAHLDGMTSWSKAFRGQPELVPKERYLALCRNGARFRFLQSLRARWQPKIIFCLGFRHEEDYLRAFGLDDLIAEVLPLQPADQIRILRLYVRDSTTWVICPALAGREGLASDVLLNAFGEFLATRLNPSDFDVAARALTNLPAASNDTLGSSITRSIPVHETNQAPWQCGAVIATVSNDSVLSRTSAA